MILSQTERSFEPKWTVIHFGLGPPKLHVETLATHVNEIFRDQIDTASCEFNEAKRRFDQAEKEYVDSKFDLQQKTEAKVGSIWLITDETIFRIH